VDGNDPDQVYQVAQSTIAQARAGKGPSLVEAKTYRHGGHSRADPGEYRPQEEVAEWLERDPVPLYRQRLLDLNLAESTLLRIEAEAQQAVDDATEKAKGSPPPSRETLETEVWVDGGSLWRN